MTNRREESRMSGDEKRRNYKVEISHDEKTDRG
jgi:hypothetical protein